MTGNASPESKTPGSDEGMSLGRRGVIAAALTVAVGALAKAGARTAYAVDVVLGGANATTTQTSITNSGTGDVLRLTNSSAGGRGLTVVNTAGAGSFGLRVETGNATAISAQVMSDSGTIGAAIEGAATISNGVAGASASGRGVSGTSSSGPGVFGESASGAGMRGQSGSGIGVVGVSNSQAGVEGTSTHSLGVRGLSTNSAGVVGISTNNHGLYGSTSHLSAVGLVGENLGGGLAGYFAGNVMITGALQVFGAKNAVIKMQDGTTASVYCQEAPEPYFEDFGKAQLTGGVANVTLEREFASLVAGGDYMVFPVPEGDTRGLFVSRKGPAGFEVREVQGGTGSLPFTYRVVTKRKDIDGRRFARVRDEVAPGLATSRATLKGNGGPPQGNIPPVTGGPPPSNVIQPPSNPIPQNPAPPGPGRPSIDEPGRP